MNNRERNWYEGKYGCHPPVCTCPKCVKGRLVQERKRERTEKATRERIAIIKTIKTMFIVTVCAVIILSFLGVEPFSSWKDTIVDKVQEGWSYVWSR